MEFSIFRQEESGNLFIIKGGTSDKEKKEQDTDGNLFIAELKLAHKKSESAMRLIDELEKRGLDSEIFYSLMGEVATAVNKLPFGI